MRLLGFDVGLRNTGWGIISCELHRLDYVDSGVITSPKNTPYAESLRYIRVEAEAVMRKYQIDEVGIEDVHPGVRRVGSIKGTSMVIGVLHELTAYMGYPEPHLIAPTRVKKSVTGDGRADKKVVLEAVAHALKLTSVVMKGKAKPGVVKAGHETDALAIAMTMLEVLRDEVD